MNANRDPWTDDEIKAALNSADAKDGPPIELMTHFISMFQRATIALETIASTCGPEVLFEEVPHNERREEFGLVQGDEPSSDGLGGLKTEDDTKH